MPTRLSRHPRPTAIVRVPGSAVVASGLALVAAAFGLMALLAAGEARAVDYDCSNFSTQAQAQGYLLPGDPYGLDADSDGIACESLPCPCSYPSTTPPPPVEATPTEPTEPREPAERLVFWKTVNEPVEIEPRAILIGTGTFGGTFKLGSLIEWRGWGAGTARADGFVSFRSCRPTCIHGRIIRRKATVVLSDIRQNCGQRRYRRIKIVVINSPYGALIGPFGTDCNGFLTRP